MIAIPAWGWKVGGLVAIGAVGFGWLREHDSRVRAEGRAEALATSVDSLRAVAEEAVAAIATKDSAVAIQKVVIQAQQKQIEEVAAVARKQTQIAVASLRETLDSAQKVMLDEIESGYERQLASKDSMLAAQARLTALAESQVADRDIAIQKIQQASTVVYDAWQVEKKRANPSFVKKAIRAVPVVLTTIGITLLAK
jgi:hypothetical protein